MELTLFNLPPDDFDQSKYKFNTSPEYRINSLQLFTKATPMCSNVEIFISDKFPLVVQYLVGDLGTLRLLLASRVHDTSWAIDPSTMEAPAKRRRFEPQTQKPGAVAELVASLADGTGGVTH